jgi:hypothetical protein
MFHGRPEDMRLIVFYAIGKGSLLAIAASALDIEFWKALTIAVVSGVIGAAGAITAAVIAVRAAERNRELLDDVRRKVGTGRRHNDPPSGEAGERR